MLNEGKLNTREAINFILAGNATFTVVSRKTQARYTYHVEESSKYPGWFVSLLNGPDNTRDFTYLGFISLREGFKLTAKSRMTADSAPVKAFAWTFKGLWSDADLTQAIEVWHVGKCGCCNRALTVPESIASGIGPVCAKKGHGRPMKRAA